MLPNHTQNKSFWRDALGWRGSITPRVLPRVAIFGIYGALVSLAHRWLLWRGVDPVHLGYTAGLLAVLLVLRTNAGYERWWEARKLWGGIVNQSRNLAIAGINYVPDDPKWQARFVRWCACFCHASRQSLRGERVRADFERVLQNTDRAGAVVAAHHMPSYVASKLAAMLAAARRGEGLDGFAFIEMEKARAQLIDHLGGCERILKTPMPRIHSIKLRRFITLYLLAVPLGLASPLLWLAPVATMLVAYPLLAIDQIAHELEKPFSVTAASHLPLVGICNTIETDLLAMLQSPLVNTGRRLGVGERVHPHLQQ